MMGSPRSAQSGITLVELLIAMGIATIIIAMSIGSWVVLSGSYSSTSRGNQQRDSANYAIERMAREIRDAERNPELSTSAIVLLDPSAEIRLYSTFNMVGASSGVARPRLVRFVLKNDPTKAGTKAVYRELPGADRSFGTSDDVSIKLVGDVVNSGVNLFTPYIINTGGELVAAPTGTSVTKIRAVKILVQVDFNPGKPPNKLELSTTVTLRNSTQL